MTKTRYPATIRGELDPNLSRWMWLVKWILAIPHLLILAFLWTAFVVMSIVAWFSIVFTGKYPRGIFDFNVGVMRWTWRVQLYAFLLGTDKYPPFSLQPDDSYPADLDIEYPEQLSRKLVWVKSWLLAIPQLIIVGAFSVAIGGSSSVALLPLAAVIMLVFTGVYPADLFSLIVGLQRWTFRVFAYVSLMRDEYPPFVLDQGSAEPNISSAKEEL